MIEILRNLLSASRRHIDEEDLLRLGDGELGSWQGRRIQRHLEQCWVCRSRYEQVQGAIVDFVDYRKRVVLPLLPLRNAPRDRFLRKIEEVSRENSQQWSARASFFIRTAIEPVRKHAFATFLIALAATAAVFILWHRNVPTVSANELLDRAQVWDTSASTHVQQSVIFQKVQIRTPSATIDRSLYRDNEGRRRPRSKSSSLQQPILEHASTAGGVNWQRPLSASDYRHWSDHLSSKNEEVLSNRNGTLTLRTKTNASDVKEESLTVRNVDFHPVARHLVLRDAEEIDISELSYDVLPWNAINVAQLFEPEAPVAAFAPVPLRRPIAPLPSLAMLEQAELRARLALNGVYADTGENISIERTRTSVTVTGFVETEPRKREINLALDGLPLVTTSISTFEARNQQLAALEQQPTSVQRQDVIVGASPLEQCLASRSFSAGQVAKLSRDLLDDALEIHREALALDSLERRFPVSAQNAMTAENKALLQQLSRRHFSALKVAIQKEWDLIGPFIRRVSDHGSSGSAEIHTAADLLHFAKENRRLSGELLSQSKDSERSGDAIFTELGDSLQQCDRIAKSLGGDAN